MQTYQVKKDIVLIGIHVITFPAGIKEAFDALIKIFGAARDYYGVSWCDENGSIQYYAMTTNLTSEKKLHNNYGSLTISKGMYRTETVHDWMRKTNCIKDVFHRMLPNSVPSKNNPCIEWYQSDEVLVCMVSA